MPPLLPRLFRSGQPLLVRGVFRRDFFLSDLVHARQTSWVAFSTARSSDSGDLDPLREALAKRIRSVRNIGIIAHIDAGKTTTTERILYLTGKTRYQGSVDTGDTVTDFMPQERERGITIQSASVTVEWEGVRINVIDTPGHVDFGIEVERCVRVLDGAALVLDGVAGVQAQTETVWRMANRQAIPAMAFVNKMDRDGANLDLVLSSMEKRLGVTPLALQIPVGVSNSFRGMIDLVTMQAILYQAGEDEKGPVKAASRDSVSFAIRSLEEAEVLDPGVKERAEAARKALIWALSEADEDFFELVLEREAEEESGAVTAGSGSSYREEFSASELLPAVRRACLNRKGVPVLCGASLRGIGVEPLLDGAVAFLPSPQECPWPVMTMLPSSVDGWAGSRGGSKNRKKGKAAKKASRLAIVRGKRDGGENETEEAMVKVKVDPLQDSLVALVFKVTHDKQRGPLSFLRIYSGTLVARVPVFNSTQGVKERPLQILLVEAEDLRCVNEVSAGDVAVAVGLSHTVTGDTLVLSDSSFCDMQLEGVPVPPPVFSLAVEAESSSQQGALENALVHMKREDPSLVVDMDCESGQTILRGIGELHLEVVCDRLMREFGVEVQTGRVYVAYREGISERAHVSEDYQPLLGGKQICIGLSVTIVPNDNLASPALVEVSEDVEDALDPDQVDALLGGLQDALGRGPIGGYPLMGLTLEVTEVWVAGDHSPPGAVRFAAASIVGTAAREGQVHLLEPFMETEVSVPEEHLGAVLQDMSANRRAEISCVEVPHDGRASTGEAGGGRRHTVRARVPLRELLGYATTLRSITAGEASFTMEFGGYTPMDPEVQRSTLEGFL